MIQTSPDYYGLYTDYYEDLQPYLEEEGINTDEVFTDGMLDPYYRPDGKLEGMPLLENVFVLAYSIPRKYHSKDSAAGFESQGRQQKACQGTSKLADAGFRILMHWI